MIHMRTGGRGSGNTQWLIKQYKDVGGKFLVPSLHSARHLVNYGVTLSQYDINTLAHKTFFMDDFFSQYRVTFADVITLDRRGRNVYMSGTLTKPLPKHFLSYMLQNYPESLL
jgi:hypothetical protein